MDEFHARHAGLFEPEKLRSKKVLIVGAGSIGSEMTRLLARSGVSRFIIMDPDTVSRSNLCRSVYVEADVGMPKVEALARCLLAIRSDFEIELHQVSTSALSDEELETTIASCDLVVATTDHPAAQARIGVLSYHACPSVFAGVYARGVGGEVLWTSPEETPCYACVLGELRGASTPSLGRTEYGFEVGTLAAEPALGMDILHVTVCAAKVGLALLLRGTGCEVERLLDPSRNVAFVGNVVDWIWREPFETVWASAKRRDMCVCRVSSGSTADLFSADELQALLKDSP